MPLVIRMVGRMNVHKKTARRLAKPSAAKMAKVLQPSVFENAGKTAVRLLLGGEKRVLLTEHQKKALRSNPSANITLSRKAAKKLQGRIKKISHAMSSQMKE